MVSKRTKAIIGAAAAAAAIAGLVYGAKKLHEKGYDKMAVKRLKEYSNKLKKEAIALEKKAVKTIKAKTKKSGIKVAYPRHDGRFNAHTMDTLGPYVSCVTFEACSKGPSN